MVSTGTISSLIVQHMYFLPPYTFFSQAFMTQAVLYTYHQYISEFIISGALAAIFFVRDYDPFFARMLENKEALISHLSWASLFLGVHTLGLYIHNNSIQSFGTSERQIPIEPIFAQWIQATQGKILYSFNIFLASPYSLAKLASQSIWLPNWLVAINSGINSLFLPIGPGDFLVHYVTALGLVTNFILVKGA